MIVCYFWPFVSLIVAELIKQWIKQKKVSVEESLATLFKVIDNVVGKKSERFAGFASNYTKESPQKDVFSEITQPDLQIEKLAEAVALFFESTKGSQSLSFRVALAEMGNKYIHKFICFYPYDKPITGKLVAYQKDNCGFTKAKKLKKMVLVADISKESQKTKNRSFVSTPGRSNIGSMIVYPVFHRGNKEVVYCLSVLCSEPNYFSSDKREFFEDIMSKFATRIELEYSLKLIKEQYNECCAVA